MVVNNSLFLIGERITTDGRIKTLLATKKGRCRWELVRDILKAIVEEKNLKKTRIMYKANLDWRNFNRYFDFLLKNGFIAKCNPGECYVLTDKGGDFLKRLKNVEEMMG